MRYLLRLDDASEYMDINKWLRIEQLLEKYDIKPIYGIIPHNEDPDLLTYGHVDNFWQLMEEWQNKGWTPALHGYNHVFETNEGGNNPVNTRSEFAGVKLERQRMKVREGYRILTEHGIDAKIFFAPAHTFDDNTLKALEIETPIRVISDTIANNMYYKAPFYFIPQQSGRVRKLPFKITTFCYHPNTMTEPDYEQLEAFIKDNIQYFVDGKRIELKKRAFSIVDGGYRFMYFLKRKIKG